MAKSKKNLTVVDIKKKDKQTFGELIEIEIDDGYTLKIDKVFRKTKIGRLVAELVEKCDFARTNNYELTSLLESYVLLLTIKYFTSLTIPDDLDEQLKVMECLINNDYLTPIINAFPQEELNKIYQTIGDTADRMIEFLDNMDSAEIENEDVLR